ncbi:SDR family NAD(P)-dependent oxidoreductase [Pelagibacterium montanilacus]|uniref:SDR family NAD(P)-dependent oxidoreductase n=1 Tax=Pelagibacterium montanilacus TaxID=2185280 RepID=UPI000F8D3F37|nr:SDR family NAD(P)-dependent oxidoreductase [Pelagibacterium montanilacus]
MGFEWNRKKVVVTGAGGFIGSHLVEELCRLGADVTAMIHYNALGSWGNLAFAEPELREQMKVVAGDIQDSESVCATLEGADIVFHLAALIAIPFSYMAPRSYIRTNIEGTLNILEAVRKGVAGKMVHTSTSEVYGTALREPIDEEHPLQGQSPYSATKIAADKLAESYWRSFNVDVVTVRPFNTFGPRQSARAFIPTIIMQALTREKIELGALDPQRDMTYVGDTVKGFIAAAASDGLAGETLNLGTGNTASVGDFARRITTLMGVDKPLVLDHRRVRPEKSEVLKLVSDNRKAAGLMGWSPTTDIDDGLRCSIEFITKHVDLYRSTDYVV